MIEKWDFYLDQKTYLLELHEEICLFSVIYFFFLHQVLENQTQQEHWCQIWKA